MEGSVALATGISILCDKRHTVSRALCFPMILDAIYSTNTFMTESPALVLTSLLGLWVPPGLRLARYNASEGLDGGTSLLQQPE